MRRIIRMIVVSVLFRIIYFKRLSMKGVQDLRFSTEFSFHNKGHIDIGKRITAFKNVTFSANGGAVTIGDYAFFNRNCILVSRDNITIGNRCLFGPNVVIYDHDHVFNSDGPVEGEFKTSPVIIEDHCWIGANVTILRGTHIGKGSVIGAGTVVKGNVPSNSIVIGNRNNTIIPTKDRNSYM